MTWSCYHRHPFLTRERTCAWLAEAIQSARTSCQFDLWAYVFMPEHVHLIVRPQRADYDIARIRQGIKEPVARLAIAWLREHAPEWIPRLTCRFKTRSRTYFWQRGGGYDRNIESSAALLNMIGYLHENPCRRGLVTRAVDWRWSSAGWYLEDRQGPVTVDRIPPEWLA